MYLRLIGFALAVAFTALVAGAQAAPVQVFSRGALGGNDFFDWDDLPPSGTSPLAVPTSTTLQSNGGAVEVLIAIAGSGARVYQGNGWGGNFALGDAVLSSATEFSITLLFDTPVRGVGTQIQANAFGAFTGRLTYQLTDTTGGFVTVNGNSTNAGDNSAVFIGVLDSVASITRVDFTIPPFGGSHAINRLDIVLPVPEPTALALFGVGLAAAGLMRRRRAAHAALKVSTRSPA